MFKSAWFAHLEHHHSFTQHALHPCTAPCRPRLCFNSPASHHLLWPIRVRGILSHATQCSSSWTLSCSVVAVGSDYTLYTDLWGESGATSGSQCSTITSTSGTDVAWSTTWEWIGGTGVKSFSNINLDVGLNVKLSSITSMVVRRHIYLKRIID